MLLELNRINKAFPGVQALSDVALQLDAGEVVGLIGENGAGKSTLLKILGGIYAPDSGVISVAGRKFRRLDVPRSMALGVQLIHQELHLAGNLNIAENIFLGAQPHRGPRWFQITNRAKLHTEATRLLKRVGLDLPSTTQVNRLSLGQQQQVEIAKALSRNARILIFDEPTSSLAFSEVSRLLTLIEELKAQGVAILYVSHRLGEIQHLADRAVVLRDGQHVGTLGSSSLTHDRMVELMVGRELAPVSAARDHAAGRDDVSLVMRVENLRFAAAREAISFDLRPGEILGFAGLVGAGRTELARALFGIDPVLAGKVYVDDHLARIRSPVDAVSHGLALVPEDRKAHGLVLPMSVRDNMNLTTLDRLAQLCVRQFRDEREAAVKLAERFSVRAASPIVPAATLSGGNQQKIVLAKWWATHPKVLVLDEPTRGVDVGAKQEIYDLTVQLAARGAGVMLISSEMEEIIRLSDRVLVMHEGRVSGELKRDEISEERIMSLAVGH